MEAVKEKKADIQAMMEAYAKLATPGPQHKLLAKMEGSWITKSKSWLDPDKPPEESTGTSENKMLYGGRFLHMEYTDTMGGKPVAGMVIIGFDNHTQKYVTATLDAGALAAESLLRGLFLLPNLIIPFLNSRLQAYGNYHRKQ